MLKMKKSIILTSITLLIILTGCQTQWQITLSRQGENAGEISRDTVNVNIENSADEITEVPLGQLFYDNGFTIIDEVMFTDENGSSTSFDWNDIGQTATINETGEIWLEGDVTLTPTEITVIPDPLTSAISYSIMDIAPTMADVLGLPELPEAEGKVIFEGKADYGVMILLDGTQYDKLLALTAEGKLPFFEQMDPIQAGLTVFPPITTSSSASFLTGAHPSKTGVYGYGYRTTELTTILDIAAQEGRTVVAVEGTSVPFNLRNAEITMSGDRDNNGYYDDNVMVNALEIIKSDMPDLMYIHFQEIDDMGHAFGPESEEYESAIMRVDSFLGEIYNVLPENTLVVIFADHGMHATADGGNHGTLIASDLIIPIIFLEK